MRKVMMLTLILTFLWISMQPIAFVEAKNHGAVQIKSNGMSVFVLKKDGTVWTWGMIFTKYSETPVRVNGLSNVVDIAAPRHLYALKEDGTVWIWENGGVQKNAAPYQVKGIANVIEIEAENKIYALKKDGTVWEIGDGVFTKGITQIKGLPKVKKIFAYEDGGAAIAADGSLWAFGSLFGHELKQPQKLSKFKNIKFAAKGYSDVPHFIDTEGHVYMMGNHATPVLVKELQNIADLHGSYYHAAAIDEDGNVWTWGDQGSDGQLGLGYPVYEYTPPTQVNGLPKAIDVEVVHGNTFILGQDGSVWMTGLNLYGVLGQGLPHHPTPVQTKGIHDITEVAAGKFHSLAVDDNGNVWAWGRNHYGQLGIGEKSANATGGKSSPVQVPGLQNVKHVFAGEDVSFALEKDGTLWAWGKNNDGMLGNGTRPENGYSEGIPVPAKVNGISQVKSVMPTSYGVFALKEDGTVWVWGGPWSDNAAPIKGLQNIVQMSSTMDYTLFLRADGTVWAVGYIDPSDYKYIYDVRPVKGIDKVKEIAATERGVMAIKQDGTVWTWDKNLKAYRINKLPALTSVKVGRGLGQDGSVWIFGNVPQNTGGEEWTYVKLDTPQRLSIPEKIVQLLDESEKRYYFLSENGSLWRLNYPTVEKMNLKNVSRLSCSSLHCLAVDQNRNVWAWGRNDSGQLGEGRFIPFSHRFLQMENFNAFETSPATSGGTSSPVTVLLNGIKRIYDQPAVIVENRTLVPLRGIFQDLGATVQWDGKTRTVTATKGDTVIVLQIGSKTATKNGQPISLEVPAQIVNGNTMVPLRFVSEALGAKVEWDGAAKTVRIIANE